MDKSTIREITNMKGKRIFLRADLNVPQDKNGAITDDTRIRESLATLRYCLDKGARVILCSHLGRPKSSADKQFSLAPVASRLQELLPNTKITLANDCIGDKVESAVKALKDGQVLLLENVRFYKEETENNAKFSKKLASLADYYVNDAFGAAHRAHASTEGIAHFLPAVSGFLLEKEVKILTEAMKSPKRPLVFILGGKKVSDKLGLIDNLLKVADRIIIGGGMSYTFVKALGGEVGDSIVDNEQIEYCANVIKRAKDNRVELLLPVDTLVADEFNPNAHTMVVESGKIPNGWQGVDIGPKTLTNFQKAIANSGTIIWNGPLGVFEFDNFSKGTRGMADACAKSSAVTIIGGGDTAFAVVKFGYGDRFTHISTGGGASLELLEGKVLPGVAALCDLGAKI